MKILLKTRSFFAFNCLGLIKDAALPLVSVFANRRRPTQIAILSAESYLYNFISDFV